MKILLFSAVFFAYFIDILAAEPVSSQFEVWSPDLQDQYKTITVAGREAVELEPVKNLKKLTGGTVLKGKLPIPPCKLSLKAQVYSPKKNSALAIKFGGKVRNLKIGKTGKWQELSFTTVYKPYGNGSFSVGGIGQVYLGGITVERLEKRPFIIQMEAVDPEPNQFSAMPVNPPTFRWPGSYGREYTIEYAPVGTDWTNAKKITTKSLFHRPETRLSPGQWQWRYKTNGCTDWSKPVAFKISADTAIWEVDTSSEGLFRNMPRRHPRIFLTPERLKDLKKRLAGPLKPVKLALEKHLDELIKQPLPYRDVKLKLPPDRSHYDHMARRWKTKDFTISLTSPILMLAVMGKTTGNRAYIENAIARADIAAGLDPDGITSSKNVAFANGAILHGLGYAYDLLNEELTPAQKKLYRERILARLNIYRPELEINPVNAHAWQTVMLSASIAALAVWDEEPQVRDWLGWAARMYVASYPWFGGVDGCSGEGFHYSKLDVTAAIATVDLWKSAAGIELDKHPWHRNYLWYVLYGYPQGFGEPGTGDRSVSRVEPDLFWANIMLILGKRYDNKYALEYARRIGISPEQAAEHITKLKDTNAFFYLLSAPVKPLPKISFATLPPAKLFSGGGEVFLDTDMDNPANNVRLEFRSSPYGSFAHVHADQNSFNISAYGEDLIVDSGYYATWGSKYHFGWSKQSKAHNLIRIDGTGQENNRIDAWGMITGFKQGKDFCIMQGDAKTAYFKTPLKHFDRKIIWVRGKEEQLFVIYDAVKVKDDKRHNYAFDLHFNEKPVITSGNTVTVTGKKAKAKITWLQPEHFSRQTLTDKSDLPAVNWRTKREDTKLYPNQWHLYSEIDNAPAKINFITVVQVGKTDGKEFVTVKNVNDLPEAARQ